MKWSIYKQKCYQIQIVEINVIKLGHGSTGKLSAEEVI